MAFYVTSRLRRQPAQSRRDAFAPRTLWLLGQPQVGRSMAFVDPEGQSVITSRIQRILEGPHRRSLYVQTHNSTYELQHVGAR